MILLVRENNNVHVVYYDALLLLKELSPFLTSPDLSWRTDIWLLSPRHPVLLIQPLAGGIEGIGIVDESLS